jgi:hypothetical protein
MERPACCRAFHCTISHQPLSELGAPKIAGQSAKVEVPSAILLWTRSRRTDVLLNGSISSFGIWRSSSACCRIWMQEYLELWPESRRSGSSYTLPSSRLLPERPPLPSGRGAGSIIQMTKRNTPTAPIAPIWQHKRNRVPSATFGLRQIAATSNPHCIGC